MYRVNGNLRNSPAYVTPTGASAPPIYSEVVHSVNAGKSTVVQMNNILRPEVFEGTADQLDDYLEDFEYIANANKWSDEEMAQKLPAFLRGPWKKWYRNQYGSSFCASYNVLKKKLQKALIGSLTSEMRFDKLFERKQAYGEDFDNYYFEKLDLIDKVNPQMSDKEIVYHLTRGLAPHLVLEVQKFGPKTPTDVRDIVARLTLGINQANARKDYAQSAVAQFEAAHSVNTILEVAEKVDQLTAKVCAMNPNPRSNHPNPRSYRNNPPLKFPERLCFTCGLPGHLAAQCPSRQSPKNNADSRKHRNYPVTNSNSNPCQNLERYTNNHPNPRPNPNQRTVVCQYCRKLGHIESRCYQKYGYPDRQQENLNKNQ